MERGGSTTQSGIYYQNSISALYLGRLIDPSERLPREHIISVRAEAPEEVDDTVVTYADEHKLFIQAKENVRENDEAWQKLWRDFKNQFDSSDFKMGEDRLMLVVGTVQNEFHALREICTRASTSENASEFYGRLVEPQKKIVRRLKSLLFGGKTSEKADDDFDENDNYLLSLLKHIEVEIYTLKYIEDYEVTRHIPLSNRSQSEIFSLLRDKVGGEARRKGTFTREQLCLELSETSVEIAAQPSVETLRQTVKMSGATLKGYKNNFGTTKIHLERGITAEIVQWTQGEIFENNFAVLLDQAGMGKTVVAQDVLLGLESANIITLSLKADVLSGIANARDLQERLNLPDRVERILDRLATAERVVLLIDQIDALSLSLAHDQVTLDVLLELVAQARLIPNVKIILSCRTFDFNNDPRLANLPVNKNFRLASLTKDEIKAVLEQIGIQYENLEPATQTLLQTPLHLDLFCRIVAEMQIQVVNDLPEKLRGLNSLQDLYAALWRYVVCKDDSRAPKTASRERVLQLIAERMDLKQEVSVPKSFIISINDEELTASAQWLASQAILIPDKNNWNLLHQTFFDYCYAKNFVESGASLYETVKTGEQGLFVRSQILQVLNYWRGVSQADYLRELHSFLNSTEIRFHLRDHVLRWFGALPTPTEEEWLIAQRFLRSADGERLQWFMRGNVGWFKYLKPGFVRALDSGDDAKIDGEVFPFLAYIFDREPNSIIEMLRPFLDRSEVWNKRIRSLFWNVKDWHKVQIEFFEEVFYLMPEAEKRDFYELNKIAELDAKAVCRMVKNAFEKEIEGIEKQDDRHGLISLRSDLEHLNGSSLVEVMQKVAETESEYFLHEMLPWLESVLNLSKEPDEDSFFFRSDLLSSGFDYTVDVVLRQVIKSFRTALINIAKTDRQTFLGFSKRLVALHYATAQRLLAQTFEQVPEDYAVEALEFLITDARRLTLGADEVFNSRQLIKAIVPHLTQEQSGKLEAAVLFLQKFIGFPYKKYPRYCFLQQFYLMSSFLPEKLTTDGKNYLAELNRKFPNQKISERIRLIEFGSVKPPISGNSIEKMSNTAWLAAFRKYSKGVAHKEPLKGGAEQLSSVLSQKTKEYPERFYVLAMQMPLDTEPAYISALVNGLADSTVNSEKLFEIVRRFSAVENEKTARATAQALEKRVKENFPDDLLDNLETGARGEAGEDEESWRREERGVNKQKYDTLNSSPYISYLNSDRGAFFRIVMRILDARNNAISKQRKWELLEFTAANGTDALKAGVIEELLYMFHEDSERCVSLFENLINRSPVLLFTYYALEFIHWATPAYFDRMWRFIEAAMNSEHESVQEHAAILACLAPLYKSVSEDSEASMHAGKLAEKAKTSENAACRRGAINVYGSNLKDITTRQVCLNGLMAMLGDSDKEVKRKMSRVFYNADESQLTDLQPFIELYIASKFPDDVERELAGFLWKYGHLEPEWSLAIIETILNNRNTANQSSRDGEFYVRLVLQIYKMSFISTETRHKALDTFDKLMRHFTYDASRILSEWDSR